MSACILSPVGVVRLPLSFRFLPLFSLLCPTPASHPPLPQEHYKTSFVIRPYWNFWTLLTIMNTLIERASTLITHKL